MRPIRSRSSSSRREAARAPGASAILEVVPEELHQRIGFIFGSREEVERIEEYHRDHNLAASSTRRCSARAACSASVS